MPKNIYINILDKNIINFKILILNYRNRNENILTRKRFFHYDSLKCLQTR